MSRHRNGHVGPWFVQFETETTGAVDHRRAVTGPTFRYVYAIPPQRNCYR